MAPSRTRVAIVGAGPAGAFAAAAILRARGDAEIDLFERLPTPWGLLRAGVAPDHQEIKRLQDTFERHTFASGCRFVGNVEVGVDLSHTELMRHYSAVIYATGAQTDKNLGIPGEDLPGVVDALTFIEHLKTHPYRDTTVGRQVVVIGAGNTAIDAVTQAKRLGAATATIVYRRGEADMSAYHYEYELAKRDGCGFRFNAAPLRVLGNGAVVGLEVRTANGTETIACDMVIIAIGQGAREALKIPEHPNVFIGGDCANGGAEIVNAAAEGVTAAKRIDEMLTGI